MSFDNSNEKQEAVIEQIESMIPGVNIESNVPQLAQQIFSKPPGKPFSIGLELETDDVESRSPEQAQTIFEILAHLLLYGVRVKYGEEQDPRRLTESQIYTINEYMRSFGFNLVLNTYDVEQKMDDPEGYTQTDIEFYRLRMLDPDRSIWHDIKIEYYKNPGLIHSHPGQLL